MADPVKIDEVTLKKATAEAIAAELIKHARRLARKANATIKQRQAYPDYGSAVDKEKQRAVVYTRSNHAKYSNARHQTLAKLL